MAVALLINGIDAATLGLTLAEAPGWLDIPARDIPTAQVIGRPGAKALADAQEGTRRVSLSGTMLDKTAALMRAKVDSVKLALLANPLVLTFGDNTGRKVTASLTAFAVRSEPQGAFVQEGLKVEATLTALDPLSYDIAQTNIALGVNRLPLGTGPIRPVVTIAGASVNPTITLFNAAGGGMASLTITLTTIAGDSLVIDMDQKTIKLNGINQIAALTAGDFFSIDPLDQANFGGLGPYITTSSGAGTVVYNKTWR